MILYYKLYEILILPLQRKRTIRRGILTMLHHQLVGCLLQAFWNDTLKSYFRSQLFQTTNPLIVRPLTENLICNVLRLFWAKAFLLLILFMSPIWHTSNFLRSLVMKWFGQKSRTHADKLQLAPPIQKTLPTYLCRVPASSR